MAAASTKEANKEEKVVRHGGYGCDEDVWLVAQEASTEVMVAKVGYERKKKRLQRREKG